MIFILEAPTKRRGIGETLANRREATRYSCTITFKYVLKLIKYVLNMSLLRYKLLIANKKTKEVIEQRSCIGI